MVDGREFQIVWQKITDEDTPELQVFEDAWGILCYDCRDLLEELASLEDTNPSPGIITEVLDKLGFEDVTQEKEEL